MREATDCFQALLKQGLLRASFIRSEPVEIKFYLVLLQ